MKKILVLMLTVVVFSFSFGMKKIYVGTNAEFKPYEYLEGDKIVGFDIELMEAMAGKLNYEVKWVNMSFSGLLPALQSNKIDIVIAGMAATPERAKAVDFSKPYLAFGTGHAVIVNKDSNILIKEDLKDKEVGVQLGSKQEQLAEKEGAKIVLFDSFAGAILALKQNKIDAVVMDENSGEEYMKKTKELKIVDKIMDNSPGESLAFKKGNKKLLKEFEIAFEKVLKNGEYLELVKKYFPNKVEKNIIK
ncbi:MAG: basic amino acid ABC transporter substrate-binding protein [Fusobacterium sp. JB021]|nr:basic amino acid ABC transporter substrate-binding protein [Fusobacterium sp. JB020]MDP0494347.1 basic amino acid ABC transporter substrate-binding protein [Fusobacterium sp. JB021]MDP0506699.1 basic amino acid ABC transporter substrate-binding protein [Fusobacterium sp. JB019]